MNNKTFKEQLSDRLAIKLYARNAQYIVTELFSCYIVNVRMKDTGKVVEYRIEKNYGLDSFAPMFYVNEIMKIIDEKKG